MDASDSISELSSVMLSQLVFDAFVYLEYLLAKLLFLTSFFGALVLKNVSLFLSSQIIYKM